MLVKPASWSMRTAVCSPHAVPSPAPSWASDTVMQCSSRDPVHERARGRRRSRARWLEAANVDHQELAVGCEGVGDAVQHRGRLGLVMDRVEGGDEVERSGAGQIGDVEDFEPDVREASRRGVRAGLCDRASEMS